IVSVSSINVSNAYQWTIAQHDPDAWTRKRVSVTEGYCWKKAKCADLPESRLECPVGLGGFEGCRKAKLNTTQSYNCPRGL
ncbi:hypothetical protein PENTCL1PPCAC_1546, partial [Pristionchus entomophagus]